MLPHAASAWSAHSHHVVSMRRFGRSQPALPRRTWVSHSPPAAHVRTWVSRYIQPASRPGMHRRMWVRTTQPATHQRAWVRKSACNTRMPGMSARELWSALPDPAHAVHVCRVPGTSQCRERGDQANAWAWHGDQANIAKTHGRGDQANIAKTHGVGSKSKGGTELN